MVSGFCVLQFSQSGLGLRSRELYLGGHEVSIMRAKRWGNVMNTNEALVRMPFTGECFGGVSVRQTQEQIIGPCKWLYFASLKNSILLHV